MGGNSTVPITFDDLYLADVAGGWAQVTKQGSNQYLFTCKVILGNGTTLTYLTDTNTQVTFDNCLTANEQILIYVRVNATLTAGRLVNSTTKTGGEGISFIDNSPNYGYYGFFIEPESTSDCTINLYGTTFNSVGAYNQRFWEATKAYNCMSLGWAEVRYGVLNTGDVNNYIAAHASNGFGNPKDGVTVNNIFVDGLQHLCGVWFRNVGSDGTLKDGTFTIPTGSYYLARMDWQGAYNLNLINVLSNSWAIQWEGTDTGKVYRKYEYDLTVLNGEITDFVENANVTLSKGGIQLGTWLTNSTGQIPTQILTYGYYNQTGGDTMYDGSNPFVLTVTHADWADYTSRFYVTEKTKMTISMQDTTTANNAALIWSLLFGALAFTLFLAWRRR